MLHVPVGSNTFGQSIVSWGTSRPSATNTTAITPATGSKGSFANVLSALSYDAYGLLILISNTSGSAASRNYCIDIGIDPAGGSSYTTVIADLLGGGAGSIVSGRGSSWYYFPLFIPAGSTVGARAQGSVTTTVYIGMQALVQPIKPSQIRKGTFVETYGATPPGGTAITPGTTSEGSWTLIGATTNDVWWWQVGMQVNTTDTSWGNAGIYVDVAVGDGSNFNVIIADNLFSTSSTETIENPPIQAGVEFPTPAGTNVYARAQHSGTLDAYNLCVYALGG